MMNDGFHFDERDGWFYISEESSREYALGDLKSLGAKSSFDIIVIFDYDSPLNEGGEIVDFVYGSDLPLSDHAKSYIRKAVHDYEKDTYLI